MSQAESANQPRPDEVHAPVAGGRATRADALVAQVEHAAIGALAGVSGQSGRGRPVAAGSRAVNGLRDAVAHQVHAALDSSAARAAASTTGGGMSGMSSIQYQLELLASLQGYLRQVQADLDGMVQQYAQKLDQLGEAGMTPERLRHFQGSVFAETRAEFIRLIERLQAVDHVQVRSYQAWLEDELSRY